MGSFLRSLGLVLRSLGSLLVYKLSTRPLFADFPVRLQVRETTGIGTLPALYRPDSAHSGPMALRIPSTPSLGRLRELQGRRDLGVSGALEELSESLEKPLGAGGAVGGLEGPWGGPGGLDELWGSLGEPWGALE